jgi:hypothetical protein
MNEKFITPRIFSEDLELDVNSTETNDLNNPIIEENSDVEIKGLFENEIQSDNKNNEVVQESDNLIGADDFFKDTIENIIQEELEKFEPEDQDKVLKALLDGIDQSSEKTTKDDLKKVINNISNLNNNIAVNNEISSLSDEIKKAINYEKNGGNVTEYFKTLVVKHNITDLDVTNEKHQEEIIRTFYRDLLDTDEIDEKITELKDLDLLSKEATKLKPKLDKKADDIANTVIKEQQAIAAQKEQLKSYTANAIATQVSTGIKGQKLTKEETSQIINDLLEERDFQYGKNKERKKIVDYMLEYNLYAKDGDKNRAVLAYMVLNPAFDKKIEKMFSSKEIDKFIEDHKTNVNKKFNLKEKTKNETSKFKFKQ